MEQFFSPNKTWNFTQDVHLMAFIHLLCICWLQIPCLNALQRAGWRGRHRASSQKSAWGASWPPRAAAHPSPFSTTTAAGAAGAGAAGIPAGCHPAVSSTRYSASALHTELTRSTEGTSTPKGTGEAEEGGGKPTLVYSLHHMQKRKKNADLKFWVLLFFLQMAATIDMNFQSDLMAIFEENLFWENEDSRMNCKRRRRKKRMNASSILLNKIMATMQRRPLHRLNAYTTSPVETENKRWLDKWLRLTLAPLAEHMEGTLIVLDVIFLESSIACLISSCGEKKEPFFFFWHSCLCQTWFSHCVLAQQYCRSKDIPILEMVKMLWITDRLRRGILKLPDV